MGRGPLGLGSSRQGCVGAVSADCSGPEGTPSPDLNQRRLKLSYRLGGSLLESRGKSAEKG